MTNDTPYRGWEYARAGDYHRNLDPLWSYTPTYLRKLHHVRMWLDALDPSERVLDAGCGEGVLVEEYSARGRKIEGLDLNYESAYVRRGNLCEMPYQNASFGAVMMLDVFEHLQFAQQHVALKEVWRVLKPAGALLMCVPNLAHLNARMRLLLRGELDRTDVDTDHPGERPLRENRKLLVEHGFSVVRETGITLTLPYVYRRVICRNAARFRWLHDVLEPLAIPSIAMVNLLDCRRGGD